MKRVGWPWRFVLVGSLPILVSLGAAYSLIAAEMERLHNRALEGELLAHARLLEGALHGGWDFRDAVWLHEAVRSLQTQSIDVLIARGDGTVLLDTTASAIGRAALLQRTEIRQALETGQGVATQYEVQRATASRVVALRVGEPAAGALLVCLTRPTWSLANDRPAVHQVLAALALVGAVSLGALTLGAGYRWARLLRAMRDTARRLSAGDLSARADAPGTDEWAALGRALDETRRRLVADAGTIDRQRRALVSLVNHLHEGVFLVRADGRVALVNPAATRLLNLGSSPDANPDALVGRTVEECLPYHELQQMLHGARAAGQREKAGSQPDATRTAEPPVMEARLRVETSAGRLDLHARLSELLLPDPDRTGGAPGWLLVVTDVTEHARALNMQTDFVANASHELRTPLASIRAAVETLLAMDLAGDPAGARGFLEIVERQSARLNALVGDLLDLSRLDSLTATFEPEEQSVGAIVRELSERFDEALARKGLQWSTETAVPTDRLVRANAHLLGLALDNLVDNAIKFTDRGGRVGFAVEGGPDWISFTVSDTGCGIPEAERERVFERFYQVERARSGADRGTGLGLAIVRQAVRALGGRVQLESQPGRGTSVTVRVPQLTES